MAKGKCMAIAQHGRINLIIAKGEKGYAEFKKVLEQIEKNGLMTWYGDVTDENGKDRSGLIITSKG